MRNTWVTCPKEGNNSAKAELIPHVVARVRGCVTKDFDRFGMGPRPIS